MRKALTRVSQLFLARIYCVLLLALPAGVVAQSNIRGTVIDTQDKLISHASVLLLNAKDSVLQKGLIAGDNGEFLFEKISDGKYLLQISSTGYEDLLRPISLEGKNLELGSIQLKPSTVELKDVKVTARKPLFEQKADRMVVNVRSSITSAGSTVLEVLARSPGVLVDRLNNTLSIAGKNGVTIMINGKITNMPLSAIVQMLASMSSSNVEKIELITTPPANFDAEGNAGFINIVFINNPFQGMNGSYTLSAGAGQGDALSGSINFNYRHKNVNLYGDYNVMRETRYQTFTNYRKVTDNGVEKETYAYNDRDAIQRNHNLRLGMDYQLTKKTVAGILLAGYNNKWTMDAVNTVNRWVAQVPDTTLSIPNHEVNHWKHFMTNLNLTHIFKENQSIAFDLNYLWYSDDNPTEYTNNYFNKSGGYLFTERTRSTKFTPIHTWVGNTDYKTKLGKNVDFETGVKLAVFRFTNDVKVETFENNYWIPDPSLTAKYKLKELIGAAYATSSIQLSEKNNLKIGLRYEYTTTELGTETEKAVVDRQYGKLFPTLFFSHKINDDNSYNFAYSRRISRPSFNDLAPFVIFMDPNTFLSGNANLLPAVQDAIKFDFIHKSYVFSVGYSYEANSIAGFQTSVDVKTNKQFLQAQNLDNTQMITLVMTIPVTVNKWWSMYNNITAVGQQAKISFDKNPTTVKVATVGFVSTHNFTLPKNYSLELSGNYETPGAFGMYKSTGFGFMTFGAQKKFKDNSTLRANISDIFSSLQFTITVDRPEQFFYTQTHIGFNRRIFSLTYTRNFGKREVKEKRERSTGSEEELRRVQ